MIYNALLPLTSGTFRTFLETNLGFLFTPAAHSFSTYLNPSIWFWLMIGRIVVSLFIFGPERTVNGIFSRSPQVEYVEALAVP